MNQARPRAGNLCNWQVNGQSPVNQSILDSLSCVTRADRLRPTLDLRQEAEPRGGRPAAPREVLLWPGLPSLRPRVYYARTRCRRGRSGLSNELLCLPGPIWQVTISRSTGIAPVPTAVWPVANSYMRPGGAPTDGELVAVTSNQTGTPDGQSGVSAQLLPRNRSDERSRGHVAHARIRAYAALSLSASAVAVALRFAAHACRSDLR